MSNNNSVPFVDLGRTYLPLKNEINQAIQKVIDSSAFILGIEVEKFENKFSKYLNVKYCAGVSSGTSALQMALKACDIGNGDEVITTSHSWVSTAEAISNVGAKPIFVDIDKDSYNIDPKKIKKHISKKTKCILPVHLYGNPADMKRICRIAKENKLFVIEDAAQAHGAKIDDKFCGTFGDLACFSFFPSKNLGSFGDAGAVVGNNKRLVENVKKLRDHGRISKNKFGLLGLNERMDGIQAAVLNVKIKHLEKYIKSRINIARVYSELLINHCVIPTISNRSRHSFHIYPILVKKRKHVLKKLREKKIDARIHYPIPIYKQPLYQKEYKNFSLPITDIVAKQQISLPIFPGMKVHEVQTVAKFLKNILHGK